MVCCFLGWLVGGCCDSDEFLFPQIVQAGLTWLPRPFAVAAVDVVASFLSDKPDSILYFSDI